VSLKSPAAYIVFVDVFVNLVNLILIRLGVAGSVGITLAVAPALYAVLLVAGYPLRGRRLLEEYGRNRRDSLVLAWGYFGLALFLSVLIGIIILSVIIGVEGFDSLIRYEYPSTPVQVHTFTQTLLLSAFSLGVVGPAEETIFRGIAYGSLLDSTGWTRWRTLNLLQAVGFGLAHLYYFYLLGPLGAVAVAEIVGMGYGLGWAYYKSGGGLAGPILVHGFWDASSFLLLYPSTLVVGGALKLLFIVVFMVSVTRIVARNRGPIPAHPNGSVAPGM
jgi:membrane protease YdiL (CAAX protease family)